MKKELKRCRLTAAIGLLVFSTILTAACGKSEIKRSKFGNEESTTLAFCSAFFTESNLPYKKLTQAEVQNTADEMLFYIQGGIVYRTLNNCNIVITERSNLRESDEYKGKKYSGELYRIFEDDEVDLLKIAASGEYALLVLPSSIPDYENDQIIISFLQFGEEYER